MKEKIKRNTVNFFKEEKYHRLVDTNYQTEAFKLLEKLDIPFDKDTDLRNYTHYIGAILDFTNSGEALDARLRADHDSTLESLHKNGEITSIFLSFSDVDKYLRIFYNSRVLNELGEVRVSEVNSIDIFENVRSKVNWIVDELINQLGFLLLSDSQLKERVDWMRNVNQFSNIEFEPSIEDLLFGGFELYSELGI